MPILKTGVARYPGQDAVLSGELDAVAGFMERKPTTAS